MIVNVEGVRGSGKTTWTLSGTLSGSSSTFLLGNIRTGTGSNNFLRGDTTEVDNEGQFLSATTTVDENSLFAVTGSAQITVGSQTRTITHIFLDPDQGVTGDDFGIRVNSPLGYSTNDSISWTGGFTLDLDISDFNIGTYTGDSPFSRFFTSDLTLIIKETTKTTSSVPEPSSLALLGLALAGLGFSRKRKGAQSRG